MALKSFNKINKLDDPLKMYQISLVFGDGVKTLSNLIAKGADKITESLNKVTQKVGINTGTFMGPNGIILKEDFELRCTSFTYPGAKMHTTDLVLFNHAKNIPVFNDKSGVFNVQVTEDTHASVLVAINNWCDLIHNNLSGIMASSEFYSTTAMMCILNENMSPRKKIYLHGVWPREIKPITVNTSESSPVTVSIDFNYDWYSETNTLL